MSEMVERVALAIAREEARIMLGADPEKVGADPRWLARAAMEAMRDVPPDMFRAAEKAGISFQTQQRVWSAMIDAALKDSP